MPESSSSARVPRLNTRRPSYASVASGAAPIMSQSYGNPTRSGSFIDLNQNIATGYDSNNSLIGVERLDNTATQPDNTSDTNHGSPKSWARGAQLPSFLSSFGTLVNGPSNNCLTSGQSDIIFIPSYLKGSAYALKLQEAYKAKHALQKNDAPTQSSLVCPPSNNMSNTNLSARAAPLYPSLTYDLIEKVSPSDIELLPPLPSKWSSYDKQSAIEVLSDGMEIKLSAQKPEHEREHESCAIRANHPMPTQCGLYYFEVTIIARKREESSIAIGFSSKKVPLTRLPGWEPESWAYHGDDGDSYCSHTSGKGYGPPFSTHDVIGCGVNFKTNSAFFTKNGVNLGTAFRDIKGEFYPSVGMKKPGEHVRVNFGQSPFIFDIDSVMEREKVLIGHEIETVITDNLSPPLRETELIQALVLQFLKHDGYVESARVFAKEVHSEKKALSMDPNVVLPDIDVKEDEDASQRHKIRAAILGGDIDNALKFTNLYFPDVLKKNEKVYFRLRCRKFIEMIRQAAELQNNHQDNGVNKVCRERATWYGDNTNLKMGIGNHESTQLFNDRMEVKENARLYSEHTNLLQETIKYGTELSAEFRDDPRKEVKNALEDAFALMAYQEPLHAKGVAYLLDASGRVAVAEELNSVILESLGKSSSSALETLYQQTTILLEDLREHGGSAAAFLNIDDYLKPNL